jgi:hypothetical protein
LTLIDKFISKVKPPQVGDTVFLFGNLEGKIVELIEIKDQSPIIVESHLAKIEWKEGAGVSYWPINQIRWKKERWIISEWTSE